MYETNDNNNYTGAFRDPRENFGKYKSTDETVQVGEGFTAPLDETIQVAEAITTPVEETIQVGEGFTINEEPAGDFDQKYSGYTPEQEPLHPTYYNNDNGGTPPPPPRTQRVKKERKPSPTVTFTRKSLGLLIAIMLILSTVLGAGSGALTHSLMDSDTAKTEVSETNPNAPYTLEDATNASMNISQITDKTQKSVVEIRTESVTSDSWMREYVTQGAGSGVIISADGYIMTNNHVIDGARKIKVTTIDDKEYDATLVGTDPLNDVAVIKIDATDLPAATYGNSDQLHVGDLAVAIGNPLGELGGTVTSGIISSLDRELNIDGKTMKLLQTDASINPGNSGGGLFNDDGQLIGLVVAKSSGSDVEGLGFAIPINTAAEVAQQLIDKGYVSGEVSTGMAYQEGYVNGGGMGGYDDFGMGGFEEFFGGGQSQQSQQTAVYIAQVNGKNAKDAGFQVGDMIYAVDDQVISSFDELSSIITSKKVGDTVKYTIVRDNQIMNIKFQLEEKTGESQKKNN